MHVCEQVNALHTVEVVVAINARANNRVEARMIGTDRVRQASVHALTYVCALQQGAIQQGLYQQKPSTAKPS
jgi:hypothetical protein